MKSTKIALDYSEYMLYNYIYNSVFCLTNTPNQFCWYNNDVVQLVDKYINKPQCRQNKKKEARKLLGHAKTLFQDLNYGFYVEKVDNVLNGLDN